MTTSQAQRGAKDLRGLSKRDWTIVVAGALVLVASFLPWEAASASALGASYSASDSAWNAGFGAWFGSLLCVAAAAAVAARHLGYAVGIRGIGPNLAACGLAIGGTALMVIRLLTLPRSGGLGVLGTSSGGYGPSFGAFAGVALAVVQAIVTLANLRASGERLPSMAAGGGRRPQAAPGFPSPGPGPQGQPPAGWHPTQAPAQPYQPSGAPQAWAGPPASAQGGTGAQAARTWPGSGPAAGPAPAQMGQPRQAPQPYRESGPARQDATQPYQDNELAVRLGRLDQLRNNGMISESEYTEQRRRIINQL
jgi:hypothetical protein